MQLLEPNRIYRTAPAPWNCSLEVKLKLKDDRDRQLNAVNIKKERCFRFQLIELSTIRTGHLSTHELLNTMKVISRERG